MKYIKKFFESNNPDYSEIDKIIEELKTISYILEDERYDVNIEFMNFKLNQHQLPSKLEIFDIGIIIDISPKIRGNNAMVVTSEEYYNEWKDRICDICREFNMHEPVIYPQVNRVRAMIATKRRIQLDNPDYLNESEKTTDTESNTCKWITDLYREVKEISYILEDEGILISYDYNDELYSRSPLYLEILLRSKNIFFRDSDYFTEYEDRLEEMVGKYIPTFDFKKVSNPRFKDGFYVRTIMLYLE